MQAPRRQWLLNIRIEGDSWADVQRELQWVAQHVVEHGTACQHVMGSPTSSSMVNIVHTKNMTHKQYVQALTQYQAERDRCDRQDHEERQQDA